VNYGRGTIVHEIPTCITAVSLENRDDPTIFVAKGPRREEFPGGGKGAGGGSVIPDEEPGFAGRGFAGRQFARFAS
jgi:hypothetical protein